MSEFAYVGRYSISDIDFTVLASNGNPSPADGLPMASFRNYATDAEIFNRVTVATTSPGVYRLTLSSVETETPGLYYIRWSYFLATIAQAYRTDVEIGTSQSSAYDILDDNGKMAVDICWTRFADMFDSAYGGPHLREYAQSSFGRDRMAQLMGLGLARMNIASQPHQGYTLETFPYTEWFGLLEWSTYIETLKHLIRSYTEQPDVQGVQTARLDRIRYADAWRRVLEDEMVGFNKALDQYKFASMGLGRSSVLVAGGIFGEWTRPVPPGRPRMMGPPIGWWPR